LLSVVAAIFEFPNNCTDTPWRGVVVEAVPSLTVPVKEIVEDVEPMALPPLTLFVKVLYTVCEMVQLVLIPVIVTVSPLSTLKTMNLPLLVVEEMPLVGPLSLKYKTGYVFPEVFPLVAVSATPFTYPIDGLVAANTQPRITPLVESGVIPADAYNAEMSLPV
jgi:hypothetical protein